jgi:hypothetical protein
LWFAISAFWMNLIVAVINEVLETLVDPSLFDSFVDAFNYVLPLGALWSPLQGMIIEHFGTLDHPTVTKSLIVLFHEFIKKNVIWREMPHFHATGIQPQVYLLNLLVQALRRALPWSQYSQRSFNS